MTSPAGGLTNRPRLATLRPELQFSTDDVGGGILYDPLRNRYIRLDAATAEILSLWPEAGTADDLSRACIERLGLLANAGQIDALGRFLVANELTSPDTPSDWHRLVETGRLGHRSVLSSLVHNYLFVQVPLFEPRRLLARLVPLFAFIFTKTAALVVLMFGLSGLYLVSRQWDVFLATLPQLFSIEGVIIYALAIAFVKTMHEFGHAITAARFGCRVPTMGICFMVLTPMLYCDVTDAWRLPSRRQRVLIGAAGLIVETSLAAIATLLWVFLPDGAVRSVVFAIATTSWIMSLVLNLNPLMRFDGYYILADALGIDNLQPRSFAVGTWWIRELLFGLGRPAPEDCSRRRLRAMALYAWAVCLYRLVVFTGIAILVYLMSFKLLGIVLFLIEIVYFIALPIVREIGAWIGMRKEILARPRTYVTLTVAAALAGLSVLPLATHITIPAVIEARDLQRVYPKRAAQVVDRPVSLGDTLSPGAVIVRLALPELDHEIRRSALAVEQIKLRLQRRSSDAVDKAESLVLEDRLASLQTSLAGYETEMAELTIRAEHAGRVVELDRQVVAGRWLQRTDAVALIVGDGVQIVRGYLSEQDMARLDLAEVAKFVPENPLLPAFAVRLEKVALAGTEEMDLPELSAHYGGGVPARPQQRTGNGKVQVPLQGQFLVTGIATEHQELHSVRFGRGALHVRGRSESLAARAWRQVLKVLIRESGF